MILNEKLLVRIAPQKFVAPYSPAVSKLFYTVSKCIQSTHVWLPIGLCEQSFQFFPSVPNATFLELGGFLNFTEMIVCPNKASAMRLPQLSGHNEASTIGLPQLLLINVAN